MSPDTLADMPKFDDIGIYVSKVHVIIAQVGLVHTRGQKFLVIQV
jgi:hypothetical protein